MLVSVDLEQELVATLLGDVGDIDLQTVSTLSYHIMRPTENEPS